MLPLRRVAVLLSILLVLGGVPPGRAAPPPVPQDAPPTTAGPWSWPLPPVPEVSRRFQAPTGPYAAGHRGVDLAGQPGATVSAAGAGVVVFAGMVAGRPVLSIDHPGGLRTTYEPVQATVGAGQQVARGTPVGVLLPGHEGCPSAACLHWGLRRGEVYLDPLALLAPPRVRLLPWD